MLQLVSWLEKKVMVAVPLLERALLEVLEVGAQAGYVSISQGKVCFRAERFNPRVPCPVPAK